ncbi:MAG TPA: class I SAM-dependent methyltransferase [Pyrinomonadaceae bacterium]|jgi:ubiquinone/menaquinone biosynthesis C-methylase UbiE|nr:class I SAM-dependent methyltransferase [Pyrinomonadaceae bacterium]
MENRTAAQIREHYEIEKQIAERLRSSSAEQRKNLYTEAYDELFKRVPHHPLLNNYSPAEKAKQIAKEVRSLQLFVNENTIYLEIGPGDCALAFEIAKQVKKVYAIDVSNEITKNADKPANFELIISDGSDIPVPPESVDVAFSNQLMEHLHPDDSFAQLKNVFRALKTGGVYFCITPNRLSGPHDVSRNFDAVAAGLHLKEYTVTELDALFRQVGFSKTRIYTGVSNIFLPVFPYQIAEKLLDILPQSIRKLLTFNKIVRFLLGVKLVGTK